MRHKLLIVGDDIRINESLKEHIFARYEEHFGEIREIKFVSKNDKDLLYMIENLIKNKDALIIVASDENYGIMARNLATLSEDVLELKDENTMATKNALRYSSGSFVVKLNETEINLIRANACETMAEILIEPVSEVRYFSLISTDKASAKILLEPLLSPYKVQISISQMTNNSVLIRCEKEKFGSIDGFVGAIKNLFSNKFVDSKDIVKFTADRLKERSLKISFAESCTAGMCAASFGRFAGVSAVFDGSLVTYANKIKSEWLGVSEEILSSVGAVSEECVRAMLRGALRASEADFALAISGVAGPDGGSDEKPVGTVYVGAGDKDGNIKIEKLSLSGDRNYIREQSKLHAFITLLELRSDVFFSV